MSLDKMTTLGEWPEPHPEHGEALDTDGAAALLGISHSTLDVRLHRTRAGTARVPFPEPDGPARNAEGQPIRYWWTVTIEAYRDAWKLGGGRRTLTADDILRVRRLHADGDSQHEISRRTGLGVATVSRIVNNKDRRGASAQEGSQP